MARLSKNLAPRQLAWMAALWLLLCGAALAHLGPHLGQAQHAEAGWAADTATVVAHAVEISSGGSAEIGSSMPCPGDGSGSCCCNVFKSGAPVQPKIGVTRSSYVNAPTVGQACTLPAEVAPFVASSRIAVHAHGSRAPPSLQA